MAARLKDYPEAVAETVRLAETLRFELTGDLGYRYPGSEDDRRDTAISPGSATREFAGRYPLGYRRRR